MYILEDESSRVATTLQKSVHFSVRRVETYIRQGCLKRFLAYRNPFTFLYFVAPCDAKSDGVRATVVVDFAKILRVSEGVGGQRLSRDEVYTCMDELCQFLTRQ